MGSQFSYDGFNWSEEMRILNGIKIKIGGAKSFVRIYPTRPHVQDVM